MELKIRKLAFYSLPISDGLYDSAEWITFINVNHVDQYGDMSELISEQLDMGYKI